jgi:hypothetical protein
MQLELDIFDSVGYGCYNFFLDVDFIINEKGNYTNRLNFEEVENTSYENQCNAYVFFPFKNRKAFICKTDFMGNIEEVCLYDNGSIEKFNVYRMPFENAKQMQEVPEDVLEYVEMQVLEVEQEVPGSEIFKKWWSLEEDETHTKDFLTMTQFRLIVGSVDLMTETVTYVPTVTTKQDRLPNSGLVRVIS